MIKKTQLLVLLLMALSFGKAVAQKSAFADAYLLVFEEQYSKVSALQASLQGAEQDFISGEVAFRKGDVKGAQDFFNKAAGDVKSPWGFIGLGRIALKNGDAKSATENFDKAVKNGKKNSAVYETVARVCLSMTTPDTANAAKYLAKGLDVDGKYAPFQTLKGDLSAVKGDFGAAANDYERAMYFDPKNTEAPRKLGVLYNRAKNYQGGLTALKKCIENNPDQITVYKNLGDLYYTFGKYADAEENYKIYLDRCEKTADDLERYSFILFFNKKYKESSEVLDQLLAKGAAESVLYRVKGYVACENGEVKEGLSYMQKFFASHNPDKFLPSDYGYYGKLLSKDGQDSLAAANYEKATVLDSTKMEYFEELAKIYSKTKKHVDAIRVYNQMIVLKADPATINFNIGKEYYFLSESLKSKTPASNGTVKPEVADAYKGAIAAFAEVQKYSPDFAGGYLWAGRVNSLLDSEATTTAAKESYEKALEVLLKGDKEKGKKSILECYRYLGSYYFLNSERAAGGQKDELKKQAIANFEQILAIDPNDAQAKDVVSKLKK